MNRRKGWMHYLEQNKNGYGELIPGIPIVEICGGRLLIENHKGIVKYDTCDLCVRLPEGILCIRGDHLRIVRMSKGKLIINGNICRVELREQEKR